jgi:hypothetical protein
MLQEEVAVVEEEAAVSMQYHAKKKRTAISQMNDLAEYKSRSSFKLNLLASLQ